MNATAVGFAFGQGLAASTFGIGRNEMLRRQGRQRVMTSEEGIPFERQLCKLAADLFEGFGDAHSPVCILFRNLEKTATWHASYRRFTDSVRRALANQEELRKEAGAALLPAAVALHDNIGGNILKTLTAGGALTGTALGSLAFLLSRNAEQSSAENAIIMEKVKAYRKLKNDIEEDMANEVQPAPRAARSRYNV
jgi:hypothetical protein